MKLIDSMAPLVILVTPINRVDHVYSCIGVTNTLRSRGHRVIYLLQSSFRGQLSTLGYEECIYHRKNEHGQMNDSDDLWINVINQYKMIGPESFDQKLAAIRLYYSSKQYRDEQVDLNEAILRAIQIYQPDLIYYNSHTIVPAVNHSRIPWIRNITISPIFWEFDDDLPPGGTGLPTDGDRTKWSEYNEMRQMLVRSSSLNDLFESLGYHRHPNDSRTIYSQSLTVYAYPEELNYPAIRKRNWFNLEVYQPREKYPDTTSLEKLTSNEFIINTLNGKWSKKIIYLTMGSIGSTDLKLMNRLIEVLGKTNHKYIVWKGSRHCEFKLSVNMYSDEHLRQNEILPHVDLLIMHGGNDMVSEAFIYGKPMVVLPLLVDQFDNAQRLNECRLGVRVDAYHFTDEELINAINRLLYNEDLHRRIEFASQRIASSNRHQELAILIERMLSKQIIYSTVLLKPYLSLVVLQ